MSTISNLCYLGFNITDFSAWQTILFDILGLELREDSPSGQYKLKFDDLHHRLTFIESDHNSVAYVGWEVETKDDFDAVYRNLTEAGVAVEFATESELADRQVLAMMKFLGPDNVPLEVCVAPLNDYIAYKPSTNKFGKYKTANFGLGHILYCHSNPAKAIEFYRNLFGMKITDYIHWDEAKATFMHCNPRHHSLAVCNPCFGNEAGELNHFMLEADNIDDVGAAYDKVNELNVPLVLSLGKHTNDKMTSFYMITPSGFAIEYGYGGEEICDDTAWNVELYNSPKIWGHQLVNE